MDDFNYDKTEAEEILIETASKFPNKRPAMFEAAQRLVDALLSMNNFAGVKIIHDQGQVKTGIRLEIQIEHHVVGVEFSPSNAIFRVNNTPLKLRYNVVSQNFEGELDKFYAPVPGNPLRRRAALAVIMEAATAAMQIPSATR